MFCYIPTYPVFLSPADPNYAHMHFERNGKPKPYSNMFNIIAYISKSILAFSSLIIISIRHKCALSPSRSGVPPEKLAVKTKKYSVFWGWP